jgi:hypothetical protein
MNAYLFVQAEVGLLVSPPANDRSALVFVYTDIRAGGKLVANVTSSSNAGDSANDNDGVGADIFKPDGLVVDGINVLTRVEPTRGTGGKGQKEHVSKSLRKKDIDFGDQVGNLPIAQRQQRRL